MDENLAAKRIGKEPHVCIRIFEDDTVYVTNKDGDLLKGREPENLKGPLNTYPQAVWFNHSPT